MSQPVDPHVSRRDLLNGLLGGIAGTALAFESEAQTGEPADPSVYIPKAHLVQDRAFLHAFMREFSFIELGTTTPTLRITHIPSELARFADHELVCYRAEGPPALVRRQEQGWDPVLTWIRGRYDAVLTAGLGILHIPQPADALARLTAAAQALDAYRLAAALKISGITKSLALTLAAVEGWRTPQEAYALSRIDETFQAEQWGEDAEAARRVAKELSEIDAVARFLALLD